MERMSAKVLNLGIILVNDCQFGISPVKYTDPESLQSDIVRKKAKIRNPYNQIAHLAKDKT